MARRLVKFTAELVETILAHLRDGLFREPAFQLVGLHPDTAKTWMRRGREEIDEAEDVLAKTGRRAALGPYGQFVIDVLAAEARIEARMLGVVTRIALAGTDERAQLQAATWYLERKRNLVYGSGALRVDLQTSAPEQYDGADEARDAADILAALDRYSSTLERAAHAQQ